MILIPKFKNQIQLTGSLSLVLIDTITGKLRQEIHVPNVVVLNGKKYIARRLAGTETGLMTHMGLGTSNTTEVAGSIGGVAGDSTLGAEITNTGGVTLYARQAVAAAVTDNKVTYTSTFAATNPSSAGGVALTEAGIFTALTGGTMLCRTVFPVVTKLTADALTITWNITIS